MTADLEITEKLLKSMLQELGSLHSQKIFVMDVSIENYKGGHLVDFSSSWTMPHFMFPKDVRSEQERKQVVNDFR